MSSGEPRWFTGKSQTHGILAANQRRHESPGKRCPMNGLVFGAIVVEGISATVALSAVAVLGYIVGVHRREVEAAKVQHEVDARLQSALESSRELEQITDNLLRATREALHQSSQLRGAHARKSVTGRGIPDRC
jgi:hypothetical protein